VLEWIFLFVLFLFCSGVVWCETQEQDGEKGYSLIFLLAFSSALTKTLIPSM